MKIFQLTDCHLFADPEHELRGTITYATFESVLADVRTRIGPEDLLVFTGDLTDAGEPDAYRHLKRLISGFSQVKIFLPGNHDDPAQLVENLRDLPSSYFAPYVFNHSDVVLISLDSTIKGEIGGELAENQLQLLHGGIALARREQKRVLVFVHHQSLSVAGYMDQHNLRKSEKFLTELESSPEVRAVVCGHIHQEFDQTRNQCRFLGTPSTCYQIQVGTFPDEEEDIVDPDNVSGYRTLWLGQDEVVTQVHRV